MGKDNEANYNIFINCFCTALKKHPVNIQAGLTQMDIIEDNENI